MTTTIEATNAAAAFAATFEQLESTWAVQSDWLLPVRKAAMARFTELGFPTTRHEEWRFTNVSPIAKTPFAPADKSAQVTAEQVARYADWQTEGSRLVFVNGQYSETLSNIAALSDGVIVASLAEAMQSHRTQVEPHLANHATYQEDAFTAMNTAFIEDGAFIYVPKSKVVEQPIQLVFVSVPGSQPTSTHPRILVVAEANAQATVVETYCGVGKGTYFTNPVTEIVAADNAMVEHYRVERESVEAYHVSDLALNQSRSSHVMSLAMQFGGRLVRNDVHALLDDEGCDCTLDGLYLIGGEQHVDNHLRVEHAKPHCRSWEYFKGVLEDKARAVFTGRIIVREDAQKTDAKQTNMNLLLSEDALVDSKPQLEIFADDVKCTHGATIGQVDDDAIFYLQSRGLTRDAARGMLVFAFASEVIEQIKLNPLRAAMQDLLFARLPQGRLLRESA